MAHPDTEATPDNGGNNMSETVPHVTRPMTVDEAAEELATYFEDTPEEVAIQKREYADQAQLAASLKKVEFDDKGDIALNQSNLELDDEDRPDYGQDALFDDPEDQEQDTDESFETDENSAIPAPVSWSKEHSAIFDALPPDAKQVIVERERERDKGLQVKTTEIAKERKELQALEQQTVMERQMYASDLAHKIEANMVAPDPALLNQGSPAYNPAEFYAQQARYEELAAQHSHMQQHAQGYEILAQHNNEMALVEYIRTNELDLKTAIPEWGDRDHRYSVIDYGGQHGFSPNEIQSASPVEVMLLNKAMRFDELMAAKPALNARVKKAPKVQKPGAKSKTGANKRSLAAAKKKLKRSGSVEDAAAVLSHLMKD